MKELRLSFHSLNSREAELEIHKASQRVPSGAKLAFSVSMDLKEAKAFYSELAKQILAMEAQVPS